MDFSWEAVLAVEGSPTGDGRLFEVGSIRWRELPLTLGYMPATLHGGDDNVVPVGRIDSIEREDQGGGVFHLIGRGIFDDSPAAQDVAGMVRDGVVRGVSVDVGLDLFQLAPWDEGVTVVEGEPGEESDGPEIDADDDGVEDEGVPGDWIQVENVVTLRVLEATIMAATVVPTPAFAEAIIRPADAPVVASAIPATPPREWFEDPRLPGPTPLTVTPDGRVYGHLAAWGVCHIGMPGCFTAPQSPTDYAMFRLGERDTDAGPVPVGQITLHANHADLSASARRASEHYQHTGAAVADVAAGEDPHGIWVAGALRPDVSAEDIVALRAAKLSGDWRDQGQGLDLVGALAVNVPGFPIPRGAVASGVESDRLVALVSAGALRVGSRAARLAGRFTRVRRAATAAGPAPVTLVIEGGTDRDGLGESLAALEALVRRSHAAELQALSARASAPALAELTQRV